MPKSEEELEITYNGKTFTATWREWYIAKAASKEGATEVLERYRISCPIVVQVRAQWLVMGLMGSTLLLKIFGVF